MKSLMLLWTSLANEMAGLCRTSTTRDIKTVTSRVEHEGLSFLTITLPQFGKDFEKSLDQGEVSRQDFQGFSWKSGLPKFLSGFLGRIFDPSSGRLLDAPDIEAILAVRQLTLLYSKLFLLSNEERERAAMIGYVKCEQELVGAHYEQADLDALTRVGNILFGRMFRDIERKLDAFEHIPKHGPGATADGLKGNRKYSQTTWPARLESVFPSIDFLLPNPSFWEELGDVEFLEPEAEIPVKVISVPKTQKTPRIIAMEPTAMQYAQQSIRELLYEGVERDNLLKALIGFKDQTPNQILAQKGSYTRNLATLDLSEASDRVSCQHVEALLALNPRLREAIFACRSSKADVPGHGIHTLSKFASMGSALSFPIEAMVFVTMIFVAIEKELNRPLTRTLCKEYVDRVRVFGDDIIVPVTHVRSVISSLEGFNLKVNYHKSFWTGRFRESCGKEYFDGHDVSIVKVRQLAPSSRRNAREVISWVSLANQLYEHGYWKTTRWIDGFLSGILKDFPVVGHDSPVLGRHSYMGVDLDSYCVRGRYQIPMVKGFSIRAPIPRCTLDGRDALLKFFLLRGDEPLDDEDHLERSGRPRVVSIQHGWCSAL